MLRNPFVYTINAEIFQGLGPKRRESCNGDQVYPHPRIPAASLIILRSPACPRSFLPAGEILKSGVGITSSGLLGNPPPATRPRRPRRRKRPSGGSARTRQASRASASREREMGDVGSEPRQRAAEGGRERGRGGEREGGREGDGVSVSDIIRDFNDMVYPFLESDTLFLESCVCVVVGCLAILRIEGCLNSTL